MTLFANRNFILLYFITIISTFGTVIYTFVLPLIIYEMSQSALAMSTMRIVDFLPNVLLGVLAGVFVDRINRNIMIRYGGLIKFILSCVMTLIIFTGNVELWHLYILGFFLSTVGYTVGNASHAIIPQLFERDQMTDIQSKFSFATTLITIIGPSVAGALLLLVAYEQLLFVYTLSLLCVWLMSIFLDGTATPERPVKQSIAQDIREGLKELFGNQQLLIPTIAILFINLATSLIIGVLVFYVIDVLEQSQEQLGLMYSIGAVGGLIGAQLIKPLRKKWNRGSIFIALHLLDACALILFFFADSWWQLGLLLAIRTCTTVMTNIIYLAIRQESTPNHLLGRVAGTSSMFMKLALPIGLFLGGIWAEVLPIPYLFLISAGIVGAIYLFMQQSDFREVV